MEGSGVRELTWTATASAATRRDETTQHRQRKGRKEKVRGIEKKVAPEGLAMEEEEAAAALTGEAREGGTEGEKETGSKP